MRALSGRSVTNVGLVYCIQEEDESEIDEEEDEVDPAELDGLADEANLSVEELDLITTMYAMIRRKQKKAR